jgi:hypothetical protein
MNHIKKYRLKNTLFGGAKGEVDTIKEYVNANYDKISDVNARFMMGFNDYDTQFKILTENDVIDSSQEQNFKDNLKKAAITRAIMLGTPLNELDETEITHHATYKNLNTSKNIIYREPKTPLDETQVTDLSEDGCGDKILFTVHFGHMNSPNVETRADAYVVDDNTLSSLKLDLPDKSRIENKFKRQPVAVPPKTPVESPKPAMNDVDVLIDILLDYNIEKLTKLNIQKINIQDLKEIFAKTIKKSATPMEHKLLKVKLIGAFTSLKTVIQKSQQTQLVLVQLIGLIKSF